MITIDLLSPSASSYANDSALSRVAACNAIGGAAGELSSRYGEFRCALRLRAGVTGPKSVQERSGSTEGDQSRPSLCAKATLGLAALVGAGGLGAPVLQYLAAAGVGTIGVIDDDVVENANLQRQVIHRDADIGVPKVFSAKAAMEAQNPFVTVYPFNRRLTPEIAKGLFADYDLVIDGTDNFDTRYLVNEAAVVGRIPLVSGALTQWEGQLSVFDPARGAPCYRCVFPHPPAPELAPNCALAGVIGPLPGIVGSMMAVEAIKVITGAGVPLRGEMVIHDALYGESRKIGLSRRADCETCAHIPLATD